MSYRKPFLWEVFFSHLCVFGHKYKGRSSHQRCSVKIGVLRNLTKFTGQHLCQSLFFIKVSGLGPATLFKKRLWNRCFPVNFVKFLRTPFYIERLWWLLFWRARWFSQGGYVRTRRTSLSYAPVSLVVLVFLLLLWSGKCGLGNISPCFRSSHWNAFWKIVALETEFFQRYFHLFWLNLRNTCFTEYMPVSASCIYIVLFCYYWSALWWHRQLFLLCSIVLYFSFSNIKLCKYFQTKNKILFSCHIDSTHVLCLLKSWSVTSFRFR